MTLQEIAETHVMSLQEAIGDQAGKMLWAGAPPRYETRGVLVKAGLIDADGHITEKGLAALDQIRRRNPHASPSVYYRPAPEGWTENACQ